VQASSLTKTLQTGESGRPRRIAGRCRRCSAHSVRSYAGRNRYRAAPSGKIRTFSSGSIHQTAVAIRKAFEDAKRNAPALLVLEELDALASSRGPLTQDHIVEEVNELLRLIETASDNGILVVVTTNRFEVLDSAVLRKGRFDHCFELKYPDEEEVYAAMTEMIRVRPHLVLPNLRQLSNRLAGRPLSDASWVVNEAARLAARAKRAAIDEIDLFSALRQLAD
jgi:cell division protease FtsH